MSIGILKAQTFISWLTPEALKNGDASYTTKMPDERISAVYWFNKYRQNGGVIKKALCNSITIEAPYDDLKIFPLRSMNENPQFGIYVSAGTVHVLDAIEFEGFMVAGPAGQDVRFYMDLY